MTAEAEATQATANAEHETAAMLATARTAAAAKLADEGTTLKAAEETALKAKQTAVAAQVETIERETAATVAKLQERFSAKRAELTALILGHFKR